MHYPYFNSKTNNRKRKNLLAKNELTNNEIKSKNNILFDELADKISKNVEISPTKIQEDLYEDLLDSNHLKKQTFNKHFKTEENKIKTRSNSINNIKKIFFGNKKLNNFLTNNQIQKLNLDRNKILNNFNKSKNKNKIYNYTNFFNSEKESLIQKSDSNNNNNLLRIKMKDFILSSKKLFNEENNFNYKMKKVIQKLRIFNQENNSYENHLYIPIIKDNLNHNCCFSFDKLINNKKNNYTMTNNKKRIRAKNKSLSINNSKYVNRENKTFKRNIKNFSLIKLNKKLANSQKRNKENDLKENYIKKIINQNKIINRNRMINTISTQKQLFIENYLNKTKDLNKNKNTFLKNMAKNNNF